MPVHPHHLHCAHSAEAPYYLYFGSPRCPARCRAVVEPSVVHFQQAAVFRVAVAKLWRPRGRDVRNAVGRRLLQRPPTHT